MELTHCNALAAANNCILMLSAFFLHFSAGIITKMTVRIRAKAEKTDTVIIEVVTVGNIGLVTEEHGPDHETGNQVGGQDHVIERDVQDQETESQVGGQDPEIESDDQGPWSGIGIGEIEPPKGVCMYCASWKISTKYVLRFLKIMWVFFVSQ